jgi:hypothetical protein
MSASPFGLTVFCVLLRDVRIRACLADRTSQSNQTDLRCAGRYPGSSESDDEYVLDRWARLHGAAMLAAILAGVSPAGRNYPVATVAITGDGAGSKPSKAR